MSDLIASYFARLAVIPSPVLTDISGSGRRAVCGVDLPGLTDRVAGKLASHGVEHGDRIIAVFGNRLEAALLLLTAMRHGITLCLQPAGTGVADLVQLKHDLGATAVISTTDEAPAGIARLAFEDLTDCAVIKTPVVKQGTPFTITFTSGSTGAPKGIVHSAESFLRCAKAFNDQAGITGADCFLNVMPMYYMAGIFNGILAPLAAGASVVIADAFATPTALRFWPMIKGNGITALWLSPTMASLIMRLDRGDKVVPDSLRRVFVGTGAMAARDAEAFYEAYGLPLLQSYGLSELLYISVDDADTPNFGSTGRPLAGVTITQDDAGALGFDSEYAFLGYLQNGVLERHQGQFATSDLGTVSSAGVLSISGRSDDIIIRGGVNVNPIELEGLLGSLLKGTPFCIIGLPDEMLGQKVVLVTEGAEADSTVLSKARALVLDHPGRAQLDGVAAVQKLPLGPTGKIRRAALHALLADGADK